MVFADILAAVNALRRGPRLALLLLFAVRSLNAAEPTRDQEALPIYESGVATLDIGDDRRFPTPR